jgi:hypothetical protein
MARPVHFEEADEQPAESYSGSGAGPLPIKGFSNSSASCWQLDPAELEEINRTGRIWVVTDTFDKLDPHPEGGRWQPTMRVTAHKEHALSGQWRK